MRMIFPSRFIVSFFAGFVGAGVSTATAVFAQSAGGNFGLNATAGSAGLASGGATSLPDFIGNLVGVGLSFIGIVFFILMLYGGFLWMTARGSEDQTSKAIGTITAGAIGMIVIMASYTITSFLFNSLTPGGSSAPGQSSQVLGCRAGEVGRCTSIGGCGAGRVEQNINACPGADEYLCCSEDSSTNARQVWCCVVGGDNPNQPNDPVQIYTVGEPQECTSRGGNASFIPFEDCTAS